MLFYSIELSLSGIKAGKTIVVVGYQADRIQEMFKDIPIEFALQKEQLGTGHAVLQAIPFLKSFGGMVLILCGDVPLVKVETLRSFIDTYKRTGSTLSVLTTVVEEPLDMVVSFETRRLAGKDCGGKRCLRRRKDHPRNQYRYILCKSPLLKAGVGRDRKRECSG